MIIFFDREIGKYYHSRKKRKRCGLKQFGLDGAAAMVSICLSDLICGNVGRVLLQDVRARVVGRPHGGLEVGPPAHVVGEDPVPPLPNERETKFNSGGNFQNSDRICNLSSKTSSNFVPLSADDADHLQDALLRLLATGGGGAHVALATASQPEQQFQ